MVEYGGGSVINNMNTMTAGKKADKRIDMLYPNNVMKIEDKVFNEFIARTKLFEVASGEVQRQKDLLKVMNKQRSRDSFRTANRGINTSVTGNIVRPDSNVSCLRSRDNSLLDAANFKAQFYR